MLNRELLWTEAKDIWCVNLEPVWGDFFGATAVGSNRPVPFLDAFPLTLWIYLKMPSSTDSKTPSQNGAIPNTRKVAPSSSSSSQSGSRVDKYSSGYMTSEIGSDRNIDFMSFKQTASRGFRDASKTSVIVDESETSGESVKTADIHVLAYVSSLVSIQVNHYQYLFLLRLSEEAAELATFLALDSNRILRKELGGSLVMGALIPQVRLLIQRK